MSIETWTYVLVGLSFAVYIGIAIWTRAASSKDFYVAGGGVSPVANGMATAADWMSAASFISMAGMISSQGRDGGVYLMGWTGGFVLLALLLAPYLRRFGKFTVPDFIGDRYESSWARLVAILCALFISFTYVAGQMRGVGLVFSRFFDCEIETGVVVGMAIVFLYSTLGGMKGITYTQVAQYCVMMFAYMVPAIFLSLMMTGNVVPQLGFLANDQESGIGLLQKLDGLSSDMGFKAYTEGKKPVIDVFCIAMALMVGTAGLPHVIVRFYTVKKVSAARWSAVWALLFIALLYTTAPAIAAFARTNLLKSVDQVSYADAPTWLKKWEKSKLVAWQDKNGDGLIQYRGDGDAFLKKENEAKLTPHFKEERGLHGERLLSNAPSKATNELYIDNDIIVMANPEMGNLPNWVIALVGAGALAAALSTAAGLLLVISTSVAHDLIKKTLKPDITEKGELLWARISAGLAVLVAAYFGIRPPGFVAEVVAFAFGLAASSFFPAIVLGIFSKRVNASGAIAGMLVGLGFTIAYIVYFKFMGGQPKDWLWGISPEGIGTFGMMINFAVTLIVSALTPPPSEAVRELVERVRLPSALHQPE